MYLRPIGHQPCDAAGGWQWAYVYTCPPAYGLWNDTKRVIAVALKAIKKAIEPRGRVAVALDLGAEVEGAIPIRRVLQACDQHLATNRKAPQGSTMMRRKNHISYNDPAQAPYC